MKTNMNTAKIPTAIGQAPKNQLFLMIFMTIMMGLFSQRARSANDLKPKYDSLTCLEIEGKIVDREEEPTCTYTVELIAVDGKIDTLLTHGKNKFKFLLARDSYYVIRMSKTGYISKMVSVDTEILAQTEDIYRFVFETSLLKEEALVHLNKEVTDMPIAIVYFNHDSNCFVHSKKYTDNIKREMRRSRSLSNGQSMISTDTKEMASGYTK